MIDRWESIEQCHISVDYIWKYNIWYYIYYHIRIQYENIVTYLNIFTSWSKWVFMTNGWIGRCWTMSYHRLFLMVINSERNRCQTKRMRMAFPILHNGVLYAFPLYLRVGGRIYLGHGAVRLYHMMRPLQKKGNWQGIFSCTEIKRTTTSDQENLEILHLLNFWEPALIISLNSLRSVPHALLSTVLLLRFLFVSHCHWLAAW